MQQFFFFLTSSITEFVNITRVCSSEPIESALPIQQYDGGELPKRKREKNDESKEERTNNIVIVNDSNRTTTMKGAPKKIYKYICIYLCSTQLTNLVI